MVIRRTETIDLADRAYSRSSREAALARAQTVTLGGVLDKASEDIDLGFHEEGDTLTVSATLMTLNRQEYAALAALLRAYGKGYSAETLHALIGDLARVYRS